MTLEISPTGVRNTPGTNVQMGRAKISVGKDLINEGKMSLHETDLVVGNDFIQRGEFSVNDPQLFAQTVLSLAKTAGSVTAFGTEVLKLLNRGSN